MSDGKTGSNFPRSIRDMLQSDSNTEAIVDQVAAALPEQYHGALGLPRLVFGAFFEEFAAYCRPTQTAKPGVAETDMGYDDVKGTVVCVAVPFAWISDPMCRLGRRVFKETFDDVYWIILRYLKDDPRISSVHFIKGAIGDFQNLITNENLWEISLVSLESVIRERGASLPGERVSEYRRPENLGHLYVDIGICIGTQGHSGAITFKPGDIRMSFIAEGLESLNDFAQTYGSDISVPDHLLERARELMSKSLWEKAKDFLEADAMACIAGHH